MITWILIAITAYLLLGCIVMLIVNELVYGCVAKKEFLRGMLIWPLGVLLFFKFFFETVLGRLLG
jgi:hypothetical protein